MSVSTQAGTLRLARTWDVGRWTFVVVLFVNLVVTSLIAAARLEPFADLATYYQEGQMLAQGNGFTQPIKINVRSGDTEPPYSTSDRFVYPMLVGVGIRLFGDSLSVANVVAAVSMTLTALPLYGIGRRLFDARAALLASILFALSPYYHAIGIQGWTHLTAMALYYACLFALTAYYFQPSAFSAFGAGACLTLAALTREESILLALPLLVVWWWRGRERTHALWFALTPLVGFGLRALYLQQTFGSAFYAERSYLWLPRWALWYYLGTFTPQEYLDYVGGIGGALSIRLYNVAYFLLEHFSDGLWYFAGVGIVPLTLLVGVLAATRLPLSHEQRRLIKLFALFMLVQVFASLAYLGYIDDAQVVRHGSHASPFLLLLSAAGLIALWQRRRIAQAVAALVLANYLLFAVAYTGAWGFALTQPVYRGPVVLAAEWARDHLPADAIILSRRAAEAHYFSGRYVVVTPSATFAETMAFARAHHITHLLVTEVERNGTPNLLQGIRAFPQNFQNVYSTEGAQIVAIMSYDFTPSLALPNELYAGKTIGRPARLYDWNDLRPRDGGAIFAALGGWSSLLSAALHPPAVTPHAATVALRAGDAIELVEYALANRALQRGDDVQVTLRWHALAPLKENYTVFVHLLDAAGVLRAQQDSPPLAGAKPTYTWQADEWLDDHYSVAVPADLPSGAYQLEVGLYDAATGVRLPLRDATGTRLADDRLLITGLSVQ